jgi:hypothetical protein
MIDCVSHLDRGKVQYRAECFPIYPHCCSSARSPPPPGFRDENQTYGVEHFVLLYRAFFMLQKAYDGSWTLTQAAWNTKQSFGLSDPKTTSIGSSNSQRSAFIQQQYKNQGTLHYSIKTSSFLTSLIILVLIRIKLEYGCEIHARERLDFSDHQ